jgi:hypothetical protein
LAKYQSAQFKREKKVKNKLTQEIVVNLKYDDEIPAYCKYFAKKKSQ